MALSDERLEKLCRKCETVKPLAEFSKAAKYKDGLQTQCKACAAAHYESRKELIRERQRANWQQYARENAATLVTKNRQRRKENKAAEAEYRTKYRTLNAPKVAAKNQVWSHLLTGRIKKMPCEVCGHEKSDAHHDDYSRPLDVRWLCRTHHRLWHVENGEGKMADPNCSRCAIEAEVRKQYDALILQLVEALENSDAALWEHDDDPSRPVHAAITAGRAQLKGKP